MLRLDVWKRICILSVFCATTATGLRAQTAPVMAPPATTFTSLHSFDGTDGANLYAGLVQGTNGKFYGTTEAGGANSGGTVFSITAGGTVTTLHSFGGNPEGANPEAGLVLGTNGSFYGTTVNGGVNGAGSVFQISPGGTLTTLYSFCALAGCADGVNPFGGLVQGTNGKFYGTTHSGGVNGDGTVFSITAAGTLTTLYSFCAQSLCTDGAIPAAGLAQGTNGKFYGTTEFGGASDFGAVFSITAGGALTTLHSFNGADGQGPVAALIQGSNQKFYGTTRFGGANADGAVFSITTGGMLTALYSFCSQAGCADGKNPDTGLIQGTDGNFYGATEGGGTNADGTIFSITAGGTLTTLHSFDLADGANPEAWLMQSTNGTFYGTTVFGGTNSEGTVFSLSVGLGPFVSLVSTSGKEGAQIGILGQGFSNASVVKFDGVQAITVTPQGTTFLKATVPAGAMTGLVTVTTGATLLTSNQSFRVTPTITSFTPPSGPVGTPVMITGTGLLQTTKVTFNGVAATTVTINSDTQVTADVPAGAATGKIAIGTPGGTATSATSFTVN